MLRRYQQCNTRISNASFRFGHKHCYLRKINCQVFEHEYAPRTMYKPVFWKVVSQVFYFSFVYRNLLLTFTNPRSIRDYIYRIVVSSHTTIHRHTCNVWRRVAVPGWRQLSNRLSERDCWLSSGERPGRPFSNNCAKNAAARSRDDEYGLLYHVPVHGCVLALWCFPVIVCADFWCLCVPAVVPPSDEEQPRIVEFRCRCWCLWRLTLELRDDVLFGCL